MGKKGCPRPAPSEDATAPYIRLLALPRDVLRTVLHLAGRPARCACRALRDGYGPLDGGLCLEHFTAHRGCRLGDLVAISGPGGYHSIHTLVLRPHPSTTDLGYALLRPLPATFPTLRTLHLDAPVTLDRSLVHHLAPLAPHLASLTASFDGLPSLAALATTLTSLHELALNCSTCAAPGILAALHPLAPVLLRLTCTTTARRGSAAQVLRSLAPFTRLTHLALPALWLGSWDQEAVALLATAMPRLQALNFEYHDSRAGYEDYNPLMCCSTANHICAALARRTALASLTATLVELPSSPPPVRLKRLCLTTYGHSSPKDPVALLEALAPSQTLTCLETYGQISSQPPVISALRLFADTLQSLTWKCCAASLPALLPLSQLTRLESLSLLIVEPGSADEHLPGEQAASAIAAALTRLTSLQLLPVHDIPPDHHHLAALVGAVARQGALRHLALSCWDLQWGSSLLAPLATSLVRLTLPSHPDNILQVVESVSGLQALLCLRLHGTFETTVQAGGAPLPALPAEAGLDGSGSSSSSAVAQRREHAGRHYPVARGHPAREGVAGALRVQLPPGLRQLCMVTERLCRIEWRLEVRVMAALLAAAAQQDCVVRMDGAQPPLSSARLPQHDDCHGYRDGASAEWVEAQRLQQKENTRLHP